MTPKPHRRSRHSRLLRAQQKRPRQTRPQQGRREQGRREQGLGIAEEAEAFLAAEQAKRLEVIRQLEPFARIRAELEARMAEVDADQANAWDAALASGWTADQLRRLGLTPPPAKGRPSRRKRKPTTKPSGLDEA